MTCGMSTSLDGVVSNLLIVVFWLFRDEHRSTLQQCLRESREWLKEAQTGQRGYQDIIAEYVPPGADDSRPGPSSSQPDLKRSRISEPVTEEPQAKLSKICEHPLLQQPWRLHKLAEEFLGSPTFVWLPPFVRRDLCNQERYGVDATQ